ncbi:Nuclear pore complex protein Nup98-Nup96 [Leucoagaricus sp. SymC.cos]|nr:Nuclear pore complex protein Nup98-Nup96 [Leucoagaricus sp. SymC.cos]
MARFRAYTSDSSSSDEEEQRPTRPLSSKAPVPAKPVEETVEQESADDGEGLSESEASSSESSSSDRDEDELVPGGRAGAATRKRNALVQDEDGEIRFAHEVDGTETRGTMGADPTIIPWAQRVGVDAQKMHVMQTSFFRMPEEAAVLKALHQDTGAKTSRKRLDTLSPPKALPRKHGREPDAEAFRSDSRERRSFAHEPGSPALKPSRKYARVDKTSSIANDNEGSFVDAGLALGRSFRVGWGPGGTLVHLGSICSPTFSSSSANSSTLNLTNTSALLASNSVNNSSVTGLTTDSAITLSSKLLQHHLSYTSIISGDTGVPTASLESLPFTSSSVPSDAADSSSPKYLDFASFASLFPTTDLSSPAMLFRLGVSLFDPIDLRLNGQRNSSSITTPSAITPDIRNRVTSLRRKAALGHWLEEAVKPSVESDLRAKANGLVSGGAYTLADAAFTHLTGHQVEKACAIAADGGYLKLSTLISQSGGDEMFRDDIREQLRVWKTEKLGPGAGTGFGSGLVGRGVWKVYSLLGGILDDDEEELADKDADVCSGLDWKRVFGLCLWYGESLEASIADVVATYERLLSWPSNAASTSTDKTKPVAKPSSPWLLDVLRKKLPIPLLSKWTNRPATSSAEPDDPLYALIKLHADPALSLSTALDPLSFSSSLLEAGTMCWHLYIILSRVMRIRDFSDRRPVGSGKTLVNGGGREGSSEDEERAGRYEKQSVEGHSPTADLLSSAYAFELESWGMIQEAIFVLLHIEGSIG